MRLCLTELYSVKHLYDYLLANWLQLPLKVSEVVFEKALDAVKAPGIYGVSSGERMPCSALNAGATRSRVERYHDLQEETFGLQARQGRPFAGCYAKTTAEQEREGYSPVIIPTQLPGNRPNVLSLEPIQLDRL